MLSQLFSALLQSPQGFALFTLRLCPNCCVLFTEQRLNVDEGGFSCGPVCTTIDASYPNGAEREGYIHTVPLTWHREAWLPPQLYPNTTYRMRGDLPHLMIGFNPGGKAYASGGQGSYGGNQYRYAHCGKLHHPCNNKGTWGDESINFWETTRNAVMKAQLLKDNIHKARRGIIYNELWMPYHKTRDQRGVPNMDALRKVGMIEVVAVPGSPGVFTPQIWLAMSPMSAYHGGAQGSEGEDVPTWAGTGMGQCPPFGMRCIAAYCCLFHEALRAILMSKNECQVWGQEYLLQRYHTSLHVRSDVIYSSETSTSCLDLQLPPIKI